MHVHGSWPFFYALASAVPTATTLRFCVYLHIDIYAEYQYADIGIVSCGRLSNYGPFLCSSGLVQYGPNIKESRVSIFFSQLLMCASIIPPEASNIELVLS